ncbi:TonB-dependent receptor [Pedobacter sp. ASV1-7]|uniref:TonB-dependent receptor n=1 Tax=Pedobacter sp. ASV1-7 TaxID=3145237 RepID=UPI0032E852DA
MRKLLALSTFLIYSYGSFAQEPDSLGSRYKRAKQAETLKEVKILIRKAPSGKTHVSSTLSGKQLDEVRGSSLGESIKEIPGVALLQTGGTISKPVIHGLHSSRIVLLNNGVRLEGQQWGAEHAPELDPFTAQSIHVIKGAESIRYGSEAMGGVILLEPPLFPASRNLEGEVNLMGATNGRTGVASVMLNGRILKIPALAWRLQSSIKGGGNIRSADYYLGNTGAKELNYSASVEYRARKAKYEGYYSRFSTDLGILYSAHIGTIEDINARIEAGRPFEDYGFSYAISAPKQKVVHDLVKLKVDYSLKNNNTFSLMYALQKNHRQEFDIRRGDREALPITDMVLSDHKLEGYYKNLNHARLQHHIGFNIGYQVNNNAPGTLSVPFIPNFDRLSAALFAIEKFVTDNYELEFGLRYDFSMFDAAGYRYKTNEGPTFYKGGRRFHNLTGSVGALWKINDYWQLNGNLGLAWRAPSANELYSDGLHHGAGLYEIGDPNLKIEQGYKFITSLKYQTSKFQINIDPYVQYIDHYIFSRPDGSYLQSNRGIFPVFKYKQSNALFAGLDLSAIWTIDPAFSYSVNGSLLKAKDLSNNSYLPYIPADRIGQTLRWELAMNKQISSLYLAAGHSFTARQYRYTLESDYAEPPSAYHLFNIKAGGTYNWGQRQVSFGITAENLFNTLYKDYMNRFRYYTHDMGRNISIRLGYKF